MKLLLASTNPRKLEELRRALPGWEIELLDAPDEPVEDGLSFLENARIKASHGRRFAPDDTWVVGEDSGIEADALGGRPGIESARWAEDGVERLLSELGAADDRRGRYVCELVALDPDGNEVRGRGTLDGSIALERRGSEGFGYDPIFVPQGLDATVAELRDGWKAEHSHRAHAAQALRATVELPPDLRAFALTPGVFLPDPLPPFERIHGDGVVYLVTPSWLNVVRVQLEPAAVASTLETARVLARERGLKKVEWSVGPLSTPDDLSARLLALGLVPADDPPFERSSASLVLATPPDRSPGVVVARPVETSEEFETADTIFAEGFGAPEDDRAAWAATLVQRWENYQLQEHVVTFLAFDGDEPIAAGNALAGGPGLMLGGAATLPGARGRGAFRALVHARWEEAARRGTPALAVEAGRMSRPILERLGFVRVGESEMFLDLL